MGGKWQLTSVLDDRWAETGRGGLAKKVWIKVRGNAEVCLVNNSVLEALSWLELSKC